MEVATGFVEAAAGNPHYAFSVEDLVLSVAVTARAHEHIMSTFSAVRFDHW
jgi:hypothetical protein